MSSEITKTEQGLSKSDQNWWTFERIEAAAKQLAKSKIGGLNEDQAMVLMLRARADHIDPILAVDMYHLIPVQDRGHKNERGEWVQGEIIGYRTTISAQEARSRFIQAGGKIRWLTDLSNCEEQTGEWTWQGETKTLTYKLETFRRNKVAVTAKGELKENWWKFGGNMLRARESLDYIRATCPHVLNGLYAHEEFDDGVDVVSSESRLVPDATPALTGTVEKAQDAPAQSVNQQSAATKVHQPTATPAKPEPPTKEDYAYVLEVLECDPGPESIRIGREILGRMESLKMWPKAQEKLGNAIASAQERMLDQQAAQASGNDIGDTDPGGEPPPEEEGCDPKVPPATTPGSVQKMTDRAPILNESELPPKDLKADLEVSRVKQWERTFELQKRRNDLESSWERCQKIQWAHASLIALKRSYESHFARLSKDRNMT